MANNKDLIRMMDVYNNPTARIPACFCLDTSLSMKSKIRSMEGEPTRLDILNQGLHRFYSSLYNNPQTRDSVEVSLVTFHDHAECISDFSRVEYAGIPEQVPHLIPGGRHTNLGEGLNLSLDLLQRRKDDYKNGGIEYYQPWLIVMTDGKSNTSPHELERARGRILELVEDDKLSVYPFLIGNGDGEATLASISPKQPPRRIHETDIDSLFRWIGMSMDKIGQGLIPTPWNAPLN